MIKIEGLTKTYQSGTQAVKNLNLSIDSGEILALLGPNGAGKSTTIRVLTTLSGFDDGKVQVAGYDVDRDPDQVRQSIGYVAQETGIDYFLTGRENLMLQGRMYRMSKADIEARIGELADYFELTPSLDQQVAAYSGGMRRKLDIATALVHRPRVLFLDEPTLGLDTKSRQSLWRYIRQLNTEFELTILLTTHYLEEADKLAHRVAIINQGEIKVVDTAESLKNSIQGDVVSIEFDDESEAMQSFSWQLRQEDYVKDATWESDRYHLYVSNGAEAIPKVMEAATLAHIKVRNITFARPTLDDVFIKYTGSSLQGDKEEGGGAWWEKWAGKGGGSGKWAKQWQKWQDTEDQPEASATSAKWPEQSDNPAPKHEQAGSAEPEWKKWQNSDQAWSSKSGDDVGSGQSDDVSEWNKWQNSNDQSPLPSAQDNENESGKEAMKSKEQKWPEQKNWSKQNWKKDDWK